MALFPCKYCLLKSLCMFLKWDSTAIENWFYRNIREKSTLKILAKVIFELFRLIFKSKRDLILENLALRQQLATQQRKTKRPKLSNIDRLFWVWLSNIWPDWKSALIIVKPETVVEWNRKVFKLYWRWKSRSKHGRPKIQKEDRDLIKQMC